MNPGKPLFSNGKSLDTPLVLIVDEGDGVSTLAENVSPFDLVLMYVTSLGGLVREGKVPRPIVRAALDALRYDLYCTPEGE